MPPARKITAVPEPEDEPPGAPEVADAEVVDEPPTQTYTVSEERDLLRRVYDNSNRISSTMYEVREDQRIIRQSVTAAVAVVVMVALLAVVSRGPKAAAS